MHVAAEREGQEGGEGWETEGQERWGLSREERPASASSQQLPGQFARLWQCVVVSVLVCQLHSMKLHLSLLQPCAPAQEANRRTSTKA